MADRIFLPVALDANGDTIAGARAYFYEEGTATAMTVYSDEAGTTAVGQPLTASSAGVFAPTFTNEAARIDIQTPEGVSMPGYPEEAFVIYDEVSLASGVIFSPVTGNPNTNAQAAIEANTAAISANTAAINSLIPVGVVWPFAMQSIPTGFLQCDGSLISRTTYSDLFAAIGTTYDSGDGSTTFGLPDLRGEALRGWDDSRGVDAGRAFGSSQLDAMQQITGTLNSMWRGATGGDSGAFLDIGPGGGADRPATSNTNSRNITFDSANSPDARTSTETRMRNVALQFCIKF